jgi:hypothetical protein
MVKIIWLLIGINTIGWLYFIGAYFVMNSGKNVDRMESSWTMFLAILGLVIILLAAVPLRLSLFAALPLTIVLGIFISKRWPPGKSKNSFAKTYYKDKKQLAIATAIENNDTLLLKELVKGSDLNIQGIRVWDWPGLNYLQFAIRLRSNPANFPFKDAANNAAIHILLQNGCAATPALAEATKYLSPKMVAALIAAGADPNTAGYSSPNPLLFGTIGTSKQENDIAILLVKSGAHVNAKNDYGNTPLMATALSAGTSIIWEDAWRLVYYLLEEAHADYAYMAPDGRSFPRIIKNIRVEAEAKQITMPPAFDKVVAWLKERQVETAPD